MSPSLDTPVSFADRLESWIAHLEHVLPGQASIRDFVHHNTLHGYAHLPFHEALARARNELGIAGYWPPERFRHEFAAGRIDATDIDAALDTQVDRVIVGDLTRRAVWRVALRHDCAPLTAARLRWKLDEESFSADVWAACVALVPRASRDAMATPVHASPLDDPLSLREVIRALSGEDILDGVRAELVRHLAAHLDLGVSAWVNPARAQGFFAAWRFATARDPGWVLASQADAQQIIAALPDDAATVIEAELQRSGLSEHRWEAALRSLALDLPGWSGMMLWREHHPGYQHTGDVPVRMADYLAVRLVLERLAADAVARRLWGVSAQLTELREYFAQHPVELRLRLACHRGELPEALASRVQQMEAPGERPEQSRAGWKKLAQEASFVVDAELAWQAASVWPLYCVATHLDCTAAALHAFGREGIAAISQTLAALDADCAGAIWLTAYERHYAEQVFAALAANHGRCSAAVRPTAQLVLCMDDREEGFRRHIEETDPTLETLGGAAHFGVFQNFRALDADEVTPLCPVVPVVVRPAHEVQEVVRDDAANHAAYRQRRLLRLQQRERLSNQSTRLELLRGTLVSLVSAPAALGALLLRSFKPAALRDRPPPPPTRLMLNASVADASKVATPDNPRLGFTDDEQAERIFNFLTSLGLTKRFAPLVVIAGHGSHSQNNPHLAAYDCGACSGRHSGPNARLFAAMANRPEVRSRLTQRGIAIPEGTWFLGAEHNTADDSVLWYDTEDLPDTLRDAFVALQASVRTAGELHAQERCRRLMSAPLHVSPREAWAHVAGRRRDFAQPRPELGHVTIASAFIGRRSMSRGAVFDRRTFLISYDPLQDAGAVLERLLLANGPVGAGISLEYYFSSVDNERFGCGTKTMHNITGGIGVMAGGGGDLRTGLPRQMIEIHEPMRLLIVVEQSLEIITAVYQRQPPLQELVGKGWVLLAAKDPASAAIHRFDPHSGWQPWQLPRDTLALPQVARSHDWFAGHREPLPPALLLTPATAHRTRSVA